MEGLLLVIAVLGGLFLGFIVLGTLGGSKKEDKPARWVGNNTWCNKNKNW